MPTCVYRICRKRKEMSHATSPARKHFCVALEDGEGKPLDGPRMVTALESLKDRVRCDDGSRDPDQEAAQERLVSMIRQWNATPSGARGLSPAFPNSADHPSSLAGAQGFGDAPCGEHGAWRPAFLAVVAGPHPVSQHRTCQMGRSLVVKRVRCGWRGFGGRAMGRACSQTDVQRRIGDG